MPVFGLLFGAFGRILGMIPLKVWLALAAVVAVVIFLAYYRHEIKDAAFKQFYAAQVEETLKAKNEEIAIRDRNIVTRDEEIKALTQKNEQISSNISDLNEQLGTLKVKKPDGTVVILQTGKASTALRYAVDQLRALNMSRTPGDVNRDEKH